MAHNEFHILEKLILLLDDSRNDIYIHIDSKVKNFNFKYYEQLVKESNIYFIERKNVRWGHVSQIHCEISLIKSAISKKYIYYHLISGVDLPIKTQDEIHSFFEDNNGSEFIHFCTEEEFNNIKDRVLHYNFMRYHRSNWFSITNELANYILENEKWINKYFKYSSCADEVFLQTLVYNSKFREKLFISSFNNDYKACLREIDFKRGNPYIYRNEDFNKLINSENLFARKFSWEIDNDIVNKIFNYLFTNIETNK